MTRDYGSCESCGHKVADHDYNGCTAEVLMPVTHNPNPVPCPCGEAQSVLIREATER